MNDAYQAKLGIFDKVLMIHFNITHVSFQEFASNYKKEKPLEYSGCKILTLKYTSRAFPCQTKCFEKANDNLNFFCE